MDTVDQFFDFVERGEHALVNLNPHFVLVPIYTSIMALFVHAVYSGDNLHTHVLLPYRHLVVSTSPAPRAPARKSSSATGTIATAAGFLRTRFVDLERTAFDIQAVEFCNRLSGVIARPEFDESKTA